MLRKPPSGRIVAAAAVVMLHLLVIALLISADRLRRTDRSEEERAGILELLSLYPQVRQSPERARAARRRRRTRTRSLAGARIPILVAPRQPPGPISVPSGPKVDWNHEAEVAAHTITGARGTGAHPGSGEHEHSPYHKCGPSPGFAWDPEPKKAGFIGPFPYLRTKRCFISLFAFGCAIGRLPEANGHLLAAIKDGPATFSSVPDDNNCDQ
jgi:hypothetical protein